MSKSESDPDGGHESALMEQDYPELMNVARSTRENHGIDISTDAPKKPEFVERMAEEDIQLDDGTWMVGDEEIDRLPSNPTPDTDGPSEPRPEVVLYCQTRAGTTEERLEEIEDALGDIGYELRENDREDTLNIIVPPEESGIDPDEVTRDEVYEMAQDLDIDGRSDMSRAELIEAVEAER